MPIPPKLSREKRLENLKIACAARTVRSQAKQRLRHGEISLQELIDLGKKDSVISRIKIIDLLLMLPQVGKTKARQIMTDCQIAPSRRLRGLGSKQALRLIDAVVIY